MKDTYDNVIWQGALRTLDEFSVHEAQAEVHLDPLGRFLPVVRVFRGGVLWDSITCQPIDSEDGAIKRAQWLAEALRPEVTSKDPVYEE